MRTRRAVVDALLALLDEGDLKPSAERVAERAGVSLRALWANFTDLETLYAAAGQRQLERQSELTRRISPRLPLNQRQYEIARAELAELFAAELTAAGAQAGELLDALTAVTTWRVWETLRDDFELNVTAARQAMARTVRGLLSAPAQTQ